MKELYKSKNFDNNLNAPRMKKQITKNLWASNEILQQTSNNIAPIDKGDLRQNVTVKKKDSSVTVTWNEPYADVRYRINKANPQTKEWVKKAWKKKKPALLKMMQKDVIK